MECRLVQVLGAEDVHLAWCSTGQVLAAIAAIEKAERIEPDSGPGVGGFTPLCDRESENAETVELDPVTVATLKDDIDRRADVAAERDFGEPWSSTTTADWRVADRHGRTIVDPLGSDLHVDDDREYTRRIAACVNVCAGLPTEKLEKIAVAAFACKGGAR